MISKKDIEERKETIIVDINTVKERLVEYEQKKLDDTALINALTGALQQCEYFLKRIDDDKPEMVSDDGNDS
tara:strand:+ start:2325 stop:2540 length:216 start_codon:yes stop_codon:yes gene_type:complete